MKTRDSFDAAQCEPNASTGNASFVAAETGGDIGKARIVRAVGFAATVILAMSLAFVGCFFANGGKAASENLTLPLGATRIGGANENAESDARAGMAGSASESPCCIPAYGGLGTEEYTFVDEPGFVSAESSPLSTLSADVDTASYCNLRRMVADGAAASEIPAGAIRTEEILNYFDYDYAPPANGDLFGVTARAGVCPWNPETFLLVLGFSTDARDAVDPDGSNLVFLIDTSGSMRDFNKLPLLKDAFSMLVEQLDECDRISIVTYSESESVLLEGASGTDKARIMSAVNGLEAGGSTNGDAGLQAAYDIARSNFIEGGVNRIVMASDGDLNVGMTSEDELHDFVERQREGGIYLSVLGFGSGNYKDAKMETIADCGNGTYHYIDCTEEARRVFDDDLRSNFVPLADDVKVQIEFNPAQIKGYRLIGYENRTLAAEGFENDAVDAGEVGAGHQFTVAYEVVPAGSSFEIDVPELKCGNHDGEEDAADGSGGHSWRDADRDGIDAKENADPKGAARFTGDSTTKATDVHSPDAVSREWLTCSMRYRPADSEKHVEQQTIVDESAFSNDPGCDWKFAAAVIECSMLLRQSDYVGSATYGEALSLIDPVDERREEFSEIVRRLSRYCP